MKDYINVTPPQHSRCSDDLEPMRIVKGVVVCVGVVIGCCLLMFL